MYIELKRLLCLWRWVPGPAREAGPHPRPVPRQGHRAPHRHPLYHRQGCRAERWHGWKILRFWPGTAVSSWLMNVWESQTNDIFQHLEWEPCTLQLLLLICLLPTKIEDSFFRFASIRYPILNFSSSCFRYIFEQFSHSCWSGSDRVDIIFRDGIGIHSLPITNPDLYPFQPDVKINYTFSRKSQYAVQIVRLWYWWES